MTYVHLLWRRINQKLQASWQPPPPPTPPPSPLYAHHRRSASSRKHCVTNSHPQHISRRWWRLSTCILTVCICHYSRWWWFQCRRSWPPRCNSSGSPHQCLPLTLWALCDSPLLSFPPANYRTWHLGEKNIYVHIHWRSLPRWKCN